MVASRLHGRRDLRVHDEPMPTPGPGEVLLRVTAVGLCGSDLHWYEDAAIGDTRLDRPLVLGHEIAAVVESGPRRGARVALDPADPCEACDTCHAGRSQFCPTMRFAGYDTTDGGLRSWMAWPDRLALDVPATLGDAEASLLEPLGVALHALDLGAIRPGMRCAVIGCGPIGLLVILALRAAGIEDIVACDPLAHRVEAARAAGAGVAWQDGAEHGDVARAEVDVAFECAGEDNALGTAMALTRPAGRIVLVGIPGTDRTTFIASAARRKGLTLVLCRRMAPTDLGRAIALVEAGRIDLTGLVSDRFPLTEAPAAFAALAERRGLKVVVQP
jgi:L-iditol 2-dehydrogenase